MAKSNDGLALGKIASATSFTGKKRIRYSFGRIPEAVQMKLAVGTSLATIIPTSIQSARKHFAKGTMDVPLLRSLAPSITAGVLAGTLAAVWLRGEALTAVFAAFDTAVLTVVAAFWTEAETRWAV